MVERCGYRVVEQIYPFPDCLWDDVCVHVCEYELTMPVCVSMCVCLYACANDERKKLRTNTLGREWSGFEWSISAEPFPTSCTRERPSPRLSTEYILIHQASPCFLTRGQMRKQLSRDARPQVADDVEESQFFQTIRRSAPVSGFTSDRY